MLKLVADQCTCHMNTERFCASCPRHVVDLLPIYTCSALIVCLSATCIYKNIETDLHLSPPCTTTISASDNPSMPKIRDSKPKHDTFEVTTTQTRRGRRITQVPVDDSQPLSSPSRTGSPSKKRAWSPGGLEHDDYDGSTADQMPKRSRTAGKVCGHLNIRILLSDKRLQTQNEFLREYLSRRHGILIEMLRHESLPSKTSCSNCQESPGMHRCQDCFNSNLWCAACCVSTHANLPFHRIQMWNGRFFERSDLLTSRLTLDLRHYPDDCPSNAEAQMMFDLGLSDEADEVEDGDLPSEPFGSTTFVESRSNLIIVSSTGIFKCSVRWCHCAKSSDQYVELLLQAKLFPASFKNPKTAFTFEVLDHFRVDALECKTAAMNFMSKIRRITDEAFPSRVPVGFPMNSLEFPLLTCSIGPISRATPSV
jgi:hypothetical protein